MRAKLLGLAMMDIEGSRCSHAFEAYALVEPALKGLITLKQRLSLTSSTLLYCIIIYIHAADVLLSLTHLVLLT